MPAKGYVWDDEYREKYYSSPKVQYHLECFREQAQVPKTDETKLKMSLAKRNKPKTDEQKAKMAETQRMRHRLYKELSLTNPEWSRAVIWKEVKRILDERNSRN